MVNFASARVIISNNTTDSVISLGAKGGVISLNDNRLVGHNQVELLDQVLKCMCQYENQVPG